MYREDLLLKLAALNPAACADRGSTPLFRLDAANAFDVPQLQAAVDLTAEELLRVARTVGEA